MLNQISRFEIEIASDIKMDRIHSTIMGVDNFGYVACYWWAITHKDLVHKFTDKQEYADFIKQKLLHLHTTSNGFDLTMANFLSPNTKILVEYERKFDDEDVPFIDDPETVVDDIYDHIMQSENIDECGFIMYEYPFDRCDKKVESSKDVNGFICAKSCEVSGYEYLPQVKEIFGLRYTPRLHVVVACGTS